MQNLGKHFTVAEARAAGKTYKECGALVGVGNSRASQMVQALGRRLRYIDGYTYSPKPEFLNDPKDSPKEWTVAIVNLKKKQEHVLQEYTKTLRAHGYTVTKNA